MLVHSFWVFAGAYSLEVFRQPPSDIVVIICACVAAGASVKSSTRPGACLLIGFSVMAAAAKVQLCDRLDPHLSGTDIEITARISDFPVADDHAVTFIATPLSAPHLPSRVRIKWYVPFLTPELGEVWHLRVRLKRPRGLMNVAGFDQEAWLFRERIGATGYVRDVGHNYPLHGTKQGFIVDLRQAIVDRFTQLLPSDNATAILLAIGAGARQHIGRADWDLFARTGTSHLMAISGLHIGLAMSYAMLFGWCAGAALGQRRNARDFALVTAVVAALIYTLLTGLAVPSRRALVMALIAVLAVLLRRRVSLASLTAIAALLVFFHEPLAILAPGFKLSFCAVLVFVLLANRLQQNPREGAFRPVSWSAEWLRRLGIVQWALLIGLFPLTSAIFARVVLGAPLTNAVVLPIFNVVTVPLTLLGMMLDGPMQSGGDRLLLWAHASVNLILEILHWFDRFPALSVTLPGTQPARLWMLLLPLTMLLLPIGWPGRRLGVLAALATLLHKPPAIPPGCLDLQVIDVGQGQAVLLQTASANVLYDAGPRFASGQDLVASVLAPVLRFRRVSHIDQLIISHADLDHAGGTQSVLQQFKVLQVLAGEPLQGLSRPATRCIAGAAWSTDGVKFRILHPRAGSPFERNNASCVLEVSAGRHRILLPGDIEAPAEILLTYRGLVQNTSVVIVPHHGSRTSSTEQFVTANSTDLAIVTSGHANRWGFPKADIVARWIDSGAEILNTATSGGVYQRFCAGQNPGPVIQSRLVRQKYWHDDR